VSSSTRPGWATSEGQVTALAVIGAVVAALAQLPTPVQVAVVVVAGAVVIAYVLSRGHVKATDLAHSAGAVLGAVDNLSSAAASLRVAADTVATKGTP
jgi:hypothetical protein